LKAYHIIAYVAAAVALLKVILIIIYKFIAQIIAITQGSYMDFGTGSILFAFSEEPW
jgi:hypothetical protein